MYIQPKSIYCLEQSPMDGGLSIWSEYTACTKACNGGTKSRYRHCNQPTPKYGGKDCEGGLVEEVPCNDETCPSKLFMFCECLIFCSIFNVRELHETKHNVQISYKLEKSGG